MSLELKCQFYKSFDFLIPERKMVLRFFSNLAAINVRRQLDLGLTKRRNAIYITSVNQEIPGEQGR